MRHESESNATERKTYTSIEIELANHPLDFLLCWSPQWRCVQVVKFVEGEQLWKIWERLIAYSEDGLVTLLDFVYDVVADFGVFPAKNNRFDCTGWQIIEFDLPNAQHEIPENCCAVSHQEDATFTLLHQHVCRFGAAHRTKIPAEIFEIKSNFESSRDKIPEKCFSDRFFFLLNREKSCSSE